MRGNLVGSLTSRFGLLVAAGLAAASLAGCGGEAAMNATYDKNFHDSCLTTASQKVGPAAAETYCTCVVTQLDKTPISQRVALKADSPEVTQATNACNMPAGGPDMSGGNATTPPPMSGDTSGGGAPSGGSTNAAP
jgi:hypothetical protein